MNSVTNADVGTKKKEGKSFVGFGQPGPTVIGM